MIINENYLVEKFPFKLKPIAGSDVLQGVEDLLAVGVLLVAELVGGKGQDGQFVRVLK